MKKLMPQEIEVWYFLPAIRRELSKCMIKKGLNQKEVANKLGITESSISQYLSLKRAKKVKFSQEIKREISKSADRIIKSDHVITEIQRICKLAEKKLLICKLSKKLGFAPKECKECFTKKYCLEV